MKPPLEAYPFLPQIEHLTMYLAGLFKIDTVPHGLIHFDVVLFCSLTGNADMHLKNFSLICPVDGMVKLSPAYDMRAARLELL